MSESKRRTKNAPQQVVKTAKKSKANTRVRSKPVYKSFRLHKAKKSSHTRALPSSVTIAKKALRLLWLNKKSIATFTFIYGLLFLLFVRGIVNPINIGDIRAQVESQLGAGAGGSFEANRVIFTELAGSAAAGLSGEQAIYQIMLLVIGSLALIWLFRQQQAGNRATARMAFYRGMYPLIPFLLIIYVIFLQLLPAVIGNFLYATVTNGGIAATSLEQFIWLLLYILLLLLSFYWISASSMALMIVTLPEMTPMRALSRAKELVRFHRLSVFIKVIALMVFIALFFMIIVFPSLYIASWLAQGTYLLLSILTLPFTIAYLFVLYRELL